LDAAWESKRSELESSEFTVEGIKRNFSFGIHIDYRREGEFPEVPQSAKELGLRMLWSMHDMDHDKLAKAQAMEDTGGILEVSLSDVEIDKRYSRYFDD